jgi:hypothetical protein
MEDVELMRLVPKPQLPHLHWAYAPQPQAATGLMKLPHVCSNLRVVQAIAMQCQSGNWLI